ncbi:unnamed protein product [Vicia faba]|uniref:Uncharacterized protein n=1 Tax=Vicia faba TaxID=3906 RepID=A0AAV0Z738_VICFA|nr:unnamed protein product [Vicia faba]
MSFAGSGIPASKSRVIELIAVYREICVQVPPRQWKDVLMDLSGEVFCDGFSPDCRQRNMLGCFLVVYQPSQLITSHPSCICSSACNSYASFRYHAIVLRLSSLLVLEGFSDRYASTTERFEHPEFMYLDCSKFVFKVFVDFPHRSLDEGILFMREILFRIGANQPHPSG